MGVIRFVDRPEASTGRVVSSLATGTIKYIASRDLPKSEQKGVLIYTLDTQELFSGNGMGSPLKAISDTMTYDTLADFPARGLPNRIYINKEDKLIYYWESTNKIYVKQSQGTAEVSYDLEKKIDRFDIEEDGITTFTISETPVGKVKMLINGVSYTENEEFELDRDTRLATWIYTDTAGGFDLGEGFRVEFVYDFNPED